ncbi:MAG: transposase [Novosphingobium sp.]
MARLAGVVRPGMPHHVTQRGNRRERTFFEDGDYGLYLDLLASASERHGVEIWSYCLMPNHVHIVAVPRNGDGLGRTFRHVHRHYTGYVNARMRVTGRLWQGRFTKRTGATIGPARLHDANGLAAKRNLSYIAQICHPRVGSLTPSIPSNTAARAPARGPTRHGDLDRRSW